MSTTRRKILLRSSAVGKTTLTTLARALRQRKSVRMDSLKKSASLSSADSLEVIITAAILGPPSWRLQLGDILEAIRIIFEVKLTAAHKTIKKWLTTSESFAKQPGQQKQRCMVPLIDLPARRVLDGGRGATITGRAISTAHVPLPCFDGFVEALTRTPEEVPLHQPKCIASHGTCGLGHPNTQHEYSLVRVKRRAKGRGHTPFYTVSAL
ncbi:hypothetical protein JB92DRAFT_2836526 [Gautieria morchelliformis]|nr:hypothetical protein JB92DRAFT_2836526 [Gautieria morchelliformis]